MNQTTIDIIGGVAGLYEVLARAIPTKKNWSILHKVFQVLVTVSGFLNKGKNDADKKPGVSNVVNFLLCFIFATALFSCKTLKNTKVDCLSEKVVHVTLIDKNGKTYTFHSTYCDSIRVVVLPDTTNVKR
jgi:hypothetical protein